MARVRRRFWFGAGFAVALLLCDLAEPGVGRYGNPAAGVANLATARWQAIAARFAAAAPEGCRITREQFAELRALDLDTLTEEDVLLNWGNACLKDGIARYEPDFADGEIQIHWDENNGLRLEFKRDTGDGPADRRAIPDPRSE